MMHPERCSASRIALSFKSMDSIFKSMPCLISTTAAYIYEKQCSVQNRYNGQKKCS